MPVHPDDAVHPVFGVQGGRLRTAARGAGPMDPSYELVTGFIPGRGARAEGNEDESSSLQPARGAGRGPDVPRRPARQRTHRNNNYVRDVTDSDRHGDPCRAGSREPLRRCTRRARGSGELCGCPVGPASRVTWCRARPLAASLHAGKRRNARAYTPRAHAKWNATRRTWRITDV